MTNKIDSRERFEAWFGASKYTQVIYPTAENKAIAFDAWQARDIEIAKLTAERDELEKENAVLRDALLYWGNVINFQFTGSSEAMTFLQTADDKAQAALNQPDTSNLVVCDGAVEAWAIVPPYEDKETYLDYTDNPEAVKVLEGRGWKCQPLYARKGDQ